MRSCLGLVFVLGCGTSAHPVAAVGNTVAATPFERADLAMLRLGELALYAAAGDHLTPLTAIRIPDESDTFGWADRDHLFVETARGAVMVTEHGTTAFAAPAKADLTAPRPEGDAFEPVDQEGGLVVAYGEAWWSRCAWGIPADGFQCVSYASVRLWPSPARTTGDPPASDPAMSSDAVPAGYAVRIADDKKTAACTPPGGGPVALGTNNPQDIVLATHWVSATPARLLVIYGQYGYNDEIPTGWSLYGGCSGQLVATGATVQLGPRGLWVGTGEDSKVTVWRGATAIGELPSARVRFRP